MKKVCSSCKLEKNIDEFYPEDIIKNNRHKCIECKKKQGKEYKKTGKGIYSYKKS